LYGNAIKITDTNFTKRDWLCDEFGFTELATKFSEFRPSIDLKEAEAETEDADARGRIAAVKEKANQHSQVIAILDDKVTQLSTDLRRFVGEVSSLRSAICCGRNSDTFGRSFCSEHTNYIKAEQFPTEFGEL
jgi:hypothetical protein